MNCKKAEKKFSAYSENELDSKSRRRLEQHLDECERCAYEWRAFQNTLRIVKDMPAIVPSADFDRQLRIRLALEDLDKVSLRRRLFEYLRGRPAFAFSSVLVILLMLSVGLYFYIYPSKVSNNDEFMVRYVMPEISPREPMEQWSDFNSEAEEQLPKIYSSELKDLVRPSHKNVNTNYVLQTVSFTDDNVNSPF
ncbi:zf-HC2 domain-containing protein [bacterium]|nr:zf-HC2 domain-containing protein [bacterium]